MRMRATIACATAAIGIAVSIPAAAQVVYSNDFETNTNGFGTDGTLSQVSRSRVSLPTDSGGLAPPNQSMWLGRLGDGIAKSVDTEALAVRPAR